MKRAIFAAASLFIIATAPLAAQTPTPIPVTGNLSSIVGSGQPYAGVSIQLQNCASPVSITGYSVIVQQGYQVKADPSGVVNTTVWSNDLIDCNGTTGNSQYRLSYVVNGVVQGTPQCYQVVSTQIWNLNTQQPIACSQSAPNPQDAQYRNVNVTGCLSVDGNGCNGTGSGVSSILPGAGISCSSEDLLNGGCTGQVTVIAYGGGGLTVAQPTFSPVSGLLSSSNVTLTMTDSTPGSSIYYCANTVPSCNPTTLYSGPVTVSTAGLSYVLAYATAPNMQSSAIATWNTTIQSQVPAPWFSPGAGTYNSTTLVTINDIVQAGLNIYYTLDGTTPNCSSMLFVTPFSVAATTTVEAIACAAGFSNSAVTTGVFTINPSAPQTATPVWSLPGGTYTASNPALTVTLTDSTPGSTIYWKIMYPHYPPIYCGDPGATTYSGAITVSSVFVYAAVACASGYTTSSTANVGYNLVIPAPVFSPPSPYTGPSTSVTITSPAAGTTIYYGTAAIGSTCLSVTTYTTSISFSSTEQICSIIQYGNFSTSTSTWIGTFGGTVGPGTVGYLAKFGPSTTTVQNSYVDEVTNPGSTTVSAKLYVTDPTCMGCAGSATIGSGTAPAGVAGSAILTSDPTNGYLETNENNTGLSRVCTAANGQCPTGLSGMTATQVAIAGTATTVTSSKPLSGSGAGITTGPTSVTSGHCVQFTGTSGQIADSGSACGGGGGSYPTPVTVSGTSVAELDLTSCITSSYRDYEIRFSQITWTAGSGVTAFIQFSSDNGSTWDSASNYFYARAFNQMNGGGAGTSTDQNSGGIVPSLSASNTSNSGDIIDTRMTLYFPMNTTATKMGKIQTQINAASGGPLVFDMDGGWYYTGSSAVNAVRLVTTGTFTGQATCQPLPQ